MSMLIRKPENNGVDKFIVNLTCFDIIARCTLLTDLNTGNFVLKPNQGTSIEMYTPFAVDFTIDKIDDHNRQFMALQDDQEIFEIAKNEDYKYANFAIYNDFIAANSTIKYREKF